jgi:hypothetical protein
MSLHASRLLDAFSWPDCSAYTPCCSTEMATNYALGFQIAIANPVQDDINHEITTNRSN